MPASNNPRRPLRYLRKQTVVRHWHGWYCAEYGESPPLKWLAGECRLPVTTVYRVCRTLELSLSQSRPRRPRSE